MLNSAPKSTYRKYFLRAATIFSLLLVALGSYYLRSIGKRDDALILAVLKHDSNEAGRLLVNGANPNTQIAYDSKYRPYAWSPLAAMPPGHNSIGPPSARPTPLIVASANGDDRMVRLLLSNGAHINAEAHFSRQTALLAAIEGKHAATAELLFQNHADASTHDANGMSTLLWAVYSDDADVLRTVLKYQKESVAQRYHGMSPLELAKSMKNKAMVRALEDYTHLHGDGGGG